MAARTTGRMTGQFHLVADPALSAVCEDLAIAATQEKPATEVPERRLTELLADASEFFEDNYWNSENSRAAREVLAAQGVDEKVIRRFGVGYAPVGEDEMMD